MLQDPLKIGIIDESRHTLILSDTASTVIGTGIPLATIDVNPGGSVRTAVVSGVKYTLTISHSQTKENAPFTTDRSLIRFDVEKTNVTTGKLVTASAYLVVAAPTGGDHTSADVLKYTRSLLTLLLLGDAPDEGGGVLSDTVLQRILAGEP